MSSRRHIIKLSIATAAVALAPWVQAQQPVTLLNVSYDPTRELYKDINVAFAAWWKANTKSGQILNIQQSHGGNHAIGELCAGVFNRNHHFRLALHLLTKIFRL